MIDQRVIVQLKGTLTKRLMGAVGDDAPPSTTNMIVLTIGL
jgi:hypothetical protein